MKAIFLINIFNHPGDTVFAIFDIHPIGFTIPTYRV